MADERTYPAADYSVLPQKVTEALIRAAAAQQGTDSQDAAQDLTAQEALEILCNAENIDESTGRLVHAVQAKIKLQQLEDALNSRRKHPARRKKPPEDIDIEKWITDTEETAESINETTRQVVDSFTRATNSIRAAAADKYIKLSQFVTEQGAALVSPQMVENLKELQTASLAASLATHKMAEQILMGAQPMMQRTAEIVQQSLNIYNVDTLKEIRETIAAISDAIPQVIMDAATEYAAFKPYLLAELEKPEYEGATLEDLIHAPSLDKDGNPSKQAALFEQAVTNARKAQQDGVPLPPRYALNLQQFAEEIIPSVDGKRASKIEYPVDKINAAIWNLLEEDTHGQLRFAMEKVGGKAKKQLDLIYSIDFSALEETGIKVSKRLLPFDKRAYIAISALYNAGNSSMTLSQIHYAMGNTTRPSSNQLERLNDSITKMARAWVTVNDKAEHNAYSYDIDEHMDDNEGSGGGWRMGIYDGSLLPIERGQVIVNGRLADAAINLFREPPMMTFAKLRDQVTTVDIKLLQSPASKTDSNLQLEDYLITRITKAKRRKRQEKILLKTLYEKAGITEKKQRQRAPGKIRTYLDYFQGQGLFSSYIMEADSVTIYFCQ